MSAIHVALLMNIGQYDKCSTPSSELLEAQPMKSIALLAANSYQSGPGTT